MYLQIYLHPYLQIYLQSKNGISKTYGCNPYSAYYHSANEFAGTGANKFANTNTERY
jgi:hypothetical protein